MEITATEFRARCLELLDRVGKTGEVITVTKRGKVVAELHAPLSGKRKGAPFGFAKDRVRIIGDITEPIDFEWEAMQ